MRHLPAWLGLGAATAALGTAMVAVGLPSSYLFAALLLGLAVALARADMLEMPPSVYAAAQAVTGITLGTYLESESLRSIGDAWLAVTLVSAATLVVSIAAGMILARITNLDAPTAALGMIAGGASGIVTMARDLDGDDRLVAFMQYARVLIVVLLTPIMIPLAFPSHEVAKVVTASQPLLGHAGSWVLVVAVAAAGALGAKLLRIPAGLLLGPMILAGALTLTGALGSDLSVPPLLRETAFAVIGLQVGLRFTAATVRQVGSLVVPVLACIVLLLVACGGLAVALAATTSVSLLDAYLATTPGGLYAVLAVAFGAGANTTFIVAVQGLRVLVMVLLAPVAVRLLVGRPARAVR
jgi:membrane AbrB-like protein